LAKHDRLRGFDAVNDDVSTERPRRPRRIIRWAAPLIALVGVAVTYGVFPRHADLTRFDPAVMARLETNLWRDYYEKRYPALFIGLYEMGRHQGFSPWDSVRLAFAAASAARAFQPTTSRAEAQAALAKLIDYFGVLASGAPAAVDIRKAAQTELDWWQARRENVGPDRYGVTVARVATLLYGIDDDDIRRSGIMRAEAMAYRDSHGDDMREADWNLIDAKLSAAYALLKHAVSAPAGH
jgi:hypothetical protein